MMGDTAFLSALMNFPKEQITDETVELLQPYFQAPDFNFDSAKKASGNVAGLCNWAAAMCTYHDVAKVVEPKIATLRGAEAELKVATKEKNAAEERMAIVQGKLDEMQVRYHYFLSLVYLGVYSAATTLTPSLSYTCNGFLTTESTGSREAVPSP